MSSRTNTAKITDQLLQDIFDDENLRFSQGKKKTLRPPPILKSLTIPDGQKVGGMVSSQSSNNIYEQQSFGKSVLGKTATSNLSGIITPIQAPSPKPLNVSDFNRISDLMHRVVAVSGQSPTKTSERFFNHGYIPSEHPSNLEIAQHMKETQLHSLQESASLKDIMQEVIHCHDELQGVIINHLQFRKEVCSEVQDINRKYIDLFEQMLSNVLHTQRTKFKTQTSTIEEQNAEIKALTLKLAQETEHTARRIAEIKELKERILEVEDQRSTFQFEISRLQKRVAELNGTEATYQNLAERAEAEFQRQLKELKLNQVRELEESRFQYAKEIKAVQVKLQAAEKEVMRVKILLEKEEAKNILKGKIDLDTFKRPNRDNECQTEALDNGLFDKRDGWVLPLSKTAIARNQWRRALNFAHCSSCKGIGKYLLVVAKTMKAIHRGPELLPDPSGMTHYEHKWVLPDAYLRFLSNLPKTVEAFNPRSLQWIIRIVTYLFNHKYTVDRQDSSFGYNMQPITEYLIEMFLLKLETRTDAEIGIYRLLTTLREHFKLHPMLQVFARFLGILDETTAEEKYQFRREEMLNEQALARKRESELQVLKPRHRNKLKDEQLAEEEAKRDRELRESINNHFVRFVTISYKKLELDVLGIYLYARKCILFDNYSGVYATAIREIKQKSKLLLHFNHLLIGNVSSENGLESTQSELNASATQDAVHTHIFNVFPRDIPTHLCISEGCTNWVPIDRAVRVLRVLTEHLPPEDMMAIYHSLEQNAKFLYPDGSLNLPEGMHTLIRQAARLFVHSESPEGADIGWYEVYETYRNTTNNTLLMMAAKGGKSGAGGGSSFSSGVDDPMTDAASVTAAAASGANGGSLSPSKKHLLPTKCVVNEYIENKNKAANNSQGHGGNSLSHNNSSSDLRSSSSTTAAASAAGNVATAASAVQPEKEPRVIELLDGSLLDLSLDNEATLKYYNKKHPDIIMVNLDHILQLIVDAMVLKTADVEKRLKLIFTEGDTNKDGVLSFQEFTTIAQQVAPDFSQRKILKMFREALTQGDDCDFIGPEAFLSVCKAYGLVKLVDIDELKRTKLKAISDPPIAPVILYNNEVAATTTVAGIDDEEVNPVIHKVVPVIKKKLHLAAQTTRLQKVANQALALSRIPITKNKDFPDTPPSDSVPGTAATEGAGESQQLHQQQVARRRGSASNNNHFISQHHQHRGSIQLNELPSETVVDTKRRGSLGNSNNNNNNHHHNHQGSNSHHRGSVLLSVEVGEALHSSSVKSAATPSGMSSVVSSSTTRRVSLPLSTASLAAALPTDATPITRDNVTTPSVLYDGEAFPLGPPPLSSRLVTPELAGSSKPNTGNYQSRLNRYRNSNSNLRLHSDSEDEPMPSEPSTARRDYTSGRLGKEQQHLHQQQQQQLRSESRESGETRMREGIARSDESESANHKKQNQQQLQPVNAGHKKKSGVNMRFTTDETSVSNQRHTELELSSAAISDLFGSASEVSPVRKIRVATTVRGEGGDSVVNVSTESLNAAPTVTTHQPAAATVLVEATPAPPVDIGLLLKTQHQAAMKNVDVKSLVVNEEASKNTAELFKQQLKQRREARMMTSEQT